MPDPKRVIRRIEGRKLADFDDRLWPTILLWASLGLGLGAIIVQGGDFQTPQLSDNAWVHLGILAVIVLTLGVAIFALEGRLQRRTLLAVMISLVVHTWLSMASYHASLGHAVRPPAETEPSLEDEAPSHLPDYQWQREETVPVSDDPLASPAPTALPDMPELPGAALERGDAAAVQLDKQTPLDVAPPEPSLPSLDDVERAELTAPRRSETLAGPEISRQDLRDELAPVPVEAPTVSENLRRGDAFDAQVAQPERQQPNAAAERQSLSPESAAAIAPSDARMARRETRDAADPSAPPARLDRSLVAAQPKAPGPVAVPDAVREAAGRPTRLEPAGALPARELGSGNASLPARNRLPGPSPLGGGVGAPGVADIEPNVPTVAGPQRASAGRGNETARVGRTLSAPEIVGDGPAVPRETAPAGGGTAARGIDPAGSSAGALRRGDTSGVGEIRRPGSGGSPGAPGVDAPGGASGLVIGSGEGLRRADLGDRNAGGGGGTQTGAGGGSGGTSGLGTGRQMASGSVGTAEQIEVPIGSAGPQPGGSLSGNSVAGGSGSGTSSSGGSGGSGSGGFPSGNASIAGSAAAAPSQRMTRVDGSIPVRVPATVGPGGLGGDIRPDLGLPSRQARPEADVAHSVASRLILEKSGGSLAVDARVRDTAVPGLRQRDSRERERLATRRGGSQGTERAVELGLGFLAHHQSPDGSWSLHNFGGGRAGYERAGQASMQSDTAGTGLALLAFLGAGYTHTDGKYRHVVARGLDYLISRQKPDGDLFSGGSQYCWLYSHGIASIALCEAYGMTRDAAVRGPAQQALHFIATAQNPTEGGWRYSPGRDSDTSVSGWQLMALKSGDLAGLAVPPECYARIAHWLDGAEAGNHSRYVYRPRAEQAHQREPSKAMTAEALLMRQYLGWKRDEPNLVAGADYLRANLPELGTRGQPQRDAYYWYYASQVMFQMQGPHWEEWNGRLSELLTTSQVQTGPLSGSWDPVGPTVPDRWGAAGGRIYVTSMQLLMLEVYYRHLPLYQNLEQ